MPRLPAAGSVEGRIKGQRHKAPLGQCVCINPRPLLFHSAVRRPDYHCRIFSAFLHVFGKVHVCRKLDAVAVFIANRAALHLAAQFKCVCIFCLHGSLPVCFVCCGHNPGYAACRHCQRACCQKPDHSLFLLIMIISFPFFSGELFLMASS